MIEPKSLEWQDLVDALPGEQSESVEERLEYVFSQVERYLTQGERVFIHCSGGVTRGPSLVIAYLITRFKVSFEEAYEFVRSSRKIIEIDEIYKRALEALQ